MALIRSPTVSEPVDVKVVVLVPSLTVIAPVDGMPSVNSDVLVVSGVAPVPVAATGVGVAVVELEDDDDDWPVTCAIAACSAVCIWVLTRSCAFLVAMLERPLLSLVVRLLIAWISDVLADADCDADWAWLQ